MSMSLFVVLALGEDLNTNDLNSIANELGYAIEYSKNIELNKHTGFLPAKLDTKDAGMETYYLAVSDLPKILRTRIPKELSNGDVYQLRFGGNPVEAQTAFTTAIILNTKYEGVTIEDQAGTILSIEQLLDALRYF